MLGDESYAGATSFFKLKEVITRLTGFEYIIPTPVSYTHLAGFKHRQRSVPGTGTEANHRCQFPKTEDTVCLLYTSIAYIGRELAHTAVIHSILSTVDHIATYTEFP